MTPPKHRKARSRKPRCHCGRTIIEDGHLGGVYLPCCHDRNGCLMKTEAWADVTGPVMKMWEEGFRPIFACQIEVGDEVMYFDTFFGFRVGPEQKRAIIRDVNYVQDLGMVYFDHTGGDCEEDELSECWVRREEWSTLKSPEALSP